MVPIIKALPMDITMLLIKLPISKKMATNQIQRTAETRLRMAPAPAEISAEARIQE